MHSGHKMMLSASCNLLKAGGYMHIGLTCDEMLVNKKKKEFL
jgi:phosphopantetheine adenylyltransferase